MSLELTDDDLAAVTLITARLSDGYIDTANLLIAPFASDPKVSALAMLLGLAQAHVHCLASAIGNIEPSHHDQLIAAIPRQIHAIIKGPQP